MGLKNEKRVKKNSRNEWHRNEVGVWNKGGEEGGTDEMRLWMCEWVGA